MKILWQFLLQAKFFLCTAQLGLNLNELIETKEIILINNGGISEQIVGQLLRTINPPYMEPSLYYWTREEKGANAEIDYVIQFGSKVMPIEKSNLAVLAV